MKHFFLQIIISIIFISGYNTELKSQDLSPEQIYEKINDAVVVVLAYDFNGKLSK